MCALHIFVSKHGGSLKEQVSKVSAAKKSSVAPKLPTPDSKSFHKPSSPGPSVGSPSSSSGLKSSHSGACVSGSLSPLSESSSRPKTPSVASLAADIATKEEFKYNPEVEAAAQRWIERVTGIPSNGLSFYQFLKSGVVLCKLANKIQPNILPHIYEGNLPYRQMENIGWYITACQQLGLRDEELFETADLFAERNLNSVVNHIHVLAHWLTKRPSTSSSSSSSTTTSTSSSSSTGEGGWNGPLIEDVRDAKSLFSATLVEGSELFLSGSSSSSSSASEYATTLTDEQRELLVWANTKMKDFYMFQPGGEEFRDLSNDVKSGVKLIHLLVALCRGQAFGIYNTQPTLIWHAMQNASAILNFIASQTFQKVEGVRSVDIVTGNVNAITRLLFYLREKFDLDYLFAQTLGDLSASSSTTSTTNDTASDTIEVELLEGEEVPAHLRPLMSPEDLQYYDELARERKQAEIDANNASIQQHPTTASPQHKRDVAKVDTLQTPGKDKNEGKQTPKKDVERLTSPRATSPASAATPSSHQPAHPPSSYGHTPIKGHAKTPISTPTTTATPTKIEAKIDPVTGNVIPSSVEYPESHHPRHENVEYSHVAVEHEVEVVETGPIIESDRVKSLSVGSQLSSEFGLAASLLHHSSSPRASSPHASPAPSAAAGPLVAGTSASATSAASEQVVEASSPSRVKKPREPKRDRSKEGTSSSSGTTTPKLRDSSDSVESTSSSNSSTGVGGRSKSKSKLRRDKLVDSAAPAEPPSADSHSTTTASHPFSSSPSSSSFHAAASTDTPENVSVGAGQQQEPFKPSSSDFVGRQDSVVGSDVVSGDSSSIATTNTTDTPTSDVGPVRVHSHMRERSIPRRVNIKRTATLAAGKVVVTDQEKVLRAQQVVRKHVAVETLTTEQSYLNSLKTLIRDLLEPVKRAKVLTGDEYTSLFSNVESIASHHMRFESLLKERLARWEDSSVVSDLFLTHTGFFMEYGPYLQNYNKATVAMHYMRKKHPKFDQMIKAFEEELMKSTMQTVDSFLIMPVQRLPRYRLLLSDMRKYTAPSWQEHIDLEAAVNHVDKILQELNSHIQKDGAEQIRKMLSIESSIQGGDLASAPIMKVDRKFIKEGVIYIKKLKVGDKTKAERKKIGERLKGLKAYAFLFNDLLLLCETLKHAKSDDKCQFAFVHAYSIHDAFTITEKDRAEKNMDQIANFAIKHVDKKNKDIILYIHVESDLIVIHSNSTEDRDAWVAALKQVTSK